MPRIKIELFYDKISLPVKELVRECESIASRFDLSYEHHSAQSLGNKEKLVIANKIRSIIPQRRGAIKTSAGTILPLSGTKKLNLVNTPVILIERDGEPLYVFPCKIGETHYDVNAGIDFISSNLPELPQLPGLSEETLAELILNKPDILEPGLLNPRTEVESGAGLIDIVFQDSNGKYLLVEVERKADDKPLGQILRLCAAYERKCGLPSDEVRGLIACLRVGESIRSAAKRSGIEIAKLSISRNNGIKRNQKM
jgi:hypothetical protein